jgi:hypothetical protein
VQFQPTIRCWLGTCSLVHADPAEGITKEAFAAHPWRCFFDPAHLAVDDSEEDEADEGRWDDSESPNHVGQQRVGQLRLCSSGITSTDSAYRCSCTDAPRPIRSRAKAIVERRNRSVPN